MKNKNLKNIFRAGLLCAATSPLMASAALVVSTTNNATELTEALVAPNSGITVTSSSLVQGGATQQGTYSGFNLAPSSGSTPTLQMQNGIVLTSALNAAVPQTNTTSEYSTSSGTGSSSLLSTLAGQTTFDANIFSLTFSLAEGLNAVSMQFVFATEEFPTQTVTDIFDFFVDGINYAKFQNGALIGNTPNNPTNFISNPVAGGLYDIEWNGLTQVFTVTGLIDTTRSVHTLQIGIADTIDTLFDSAVYISGLRAFKSDDSGIGNPITVPEPGSIALLGLGVLGLMASRSRRKA